ncbi:GP-anchored serine-rich Elicitin INL13 [Phytophthora cinnamomi]|uniref:GP-anchored serine-rich Elicitin INL13 n=1 Tax=Phytophthora cinnamomi TaxID=4785 RepID=UPI00355AAF71|nr:GP-anchored serine-rich Elicitin INL13 [Phytophthora cinnamomi]
MTHDDELWAWAATQTACAPYASGTSYFNWPCNATDCTAVLASMAASMSDCTYNGVSNKVEVQNAITVCTGGDTTDPGSPSTEVPSTTAPIPATTASNTNCVASEISDMVDLYTAVGSSDECADDSSVSSTSIVITTFCGSACASKLEELATSLPNCYYGYQSENLKADLLKQLDGCTGDDTSYAINVVLSPEEATEEPSTTSPPASPMSPPASTTAPPATDTNSTSEPTPAPTQGDLGTYC